MAIIISREFIDTAVLKWGKKYEIIPSFECEKIQKPVSCHPDMTLMQIEDIFVCSPDSYSYYKGYLGSRVICGNTELSSHYPRDIAYNVLVYKNYAFAKADCTDTVVKEELNKRNIKLLNVSQGYAKCSAAVCDSGVITADESIYKECIKNDVPVLKVTPGHVKLTGYDYGFIGGASGIVDGNFLFFGDVSKHPDFEKIKSFSKCEYFDDFPLTDIGTIFSI
jgi:hypothetical protein